MMDVNHSVVNQLKENPTVTLPLAFFFTDGLFLLAEFDNHFITVNVPGVAIVCQR